MQYFMIDNLVYGGAERQAKYIIENNIGFDKLILLENYVKYDLQTSIPIEYIYPSLVKVYQRPVKDYLAVKMLCHKVNKRDTVVSFLERSNIINIKASKKTGHKAIISVRNYLTERYKDKKYLYRMYLMKKYYPKADLIITNSNESKQDLINKFNVPAEKIEVIYNLIDIDRINILKQEQINDKYKDIFKSPVILNIGSLIPQKSQKQLIEGFKLIKQKYPEYKLVIIGTGKLQKDLIETIRENRLENEVYLLGNTNNPFKYLERSEIFVLNSKYEGFPNVLLESLAVGTPVVSKNCLSGPAEMLEVTAYDNKEPQLTDYGIIFPRESNDISKRQEFKFLISSVEKLIEMRKSDVNSFNVLKINCINRSKDFSLESIINEWTTKIGN